MDIVLMLAIALMSGTLGWLFRSLVAIGEIADTNRRSKKILADAEKIRDDWNEFVESQRGHQ